MNPTQKSMYGPGGPSSKPTPYELGEKARIGQQEEDVQPSIVIENGQVVSTSPALTPEQKATFGRQASVYFALGNVGNPQQPMD